MKLRFMNLLHLHPGYLPHPLTILLLLCTLQEMLYSAVQCSAVQCSAEYNTIQCSTVQCRVQYNTVQYSAVQCRVQYSTVHSREFHMMPDSETTCYSPAIDSTDGVVACPAPSLHLSLSFSCASLYVELAREEDSRRKVHIQKWLHMFLLTIPVSLLVSLLVTSSAAGLFELLDLTNSAGPIAMLCFAMSLSLSPSLLRNPVLSNSATLVTPMARAVIGGVIGMTLLCDNSSSTATAAAAVVMGVGEVEGSLVFFLLPFSFSLTCSLTCSCSSLSACWTAISTTASLPNCFTFSFSSFSFVKTLLVTGLCDAASATTDALPSSSCDKGEDKGRGRGEDDRDAE